MNEPTNFQIMPILAGIFAIALVLLGVGVATTVFRRYLGVSRVASCLIFFVSLVAGVGAGLFRARQTSYRNFQGFSTPMERSQAFPTEAACVVAGLMAALLVLFVAKLYLTLIAGRLTEAEKSPGIDGVRAWLRGGNLALALLIPVCASIGFGHALMSGLVLTVSALMLGPVLNLVAASAEPEKPRTDGLLNERERVLKMLDDGKVTAGEAAELLNALAAAPEIPRTGASNSPSPQQRLVLAGLVVLVASFFLPWFSYSPGAELSRLMAQVQGATPAAGLNFQMPSLSFPNGAVRIAGGDIRYGLGWLVLLCGVAAAAVPYIPGNLNPSERSKAALMGLSVGALILVYLLTQNVKVISIGFLLALVGYSLQLLGTLQQKPSRLG